MLTTLTFLGLKRLFENSRKREPRGSERAFARLLLLIFVTLLLTCITPHAHGAEPRLFAWHTPQLMKVTAYCPCGKCTGKTGPWSKRRTALGDNATIYKGVAAAFSILPPRTQLAIPGIGWREVDDTGRDMRLAAAEGITHIDVRMPLHETARKFGVRWLRVTILHD